MFEGVEYWKGKAEGFKEGVMFAMKANIALNTSIEQRIRDEKKRKKVMKYG